MSSLSAPVVHCFVLGVSPTSAWIRSSNDERFGSRARLEQEETAVATACDCNARCTIIRCPPTTTSTMPRSKARDSFQLQQSPVQAKRDVRETEDLDLDEEDLDVLSLPRRHHDEEEFEEEIERAGLLGRGRSKPIRATPTEILRGLWKDDLTITQNLRSLWRQLPNAYRIPLYTFIILLFFLLIARIVTPSVPPTKFRPPRPMVSNGTHPFAPTVLMISIDGLRADYLDRGLTPELAAIGRQGLKAEWMRPVFPSLTFPNHWALMTGLYPESHGIVANNFWDPVTAREFLYTDEDKSWDAEWWAGEPLWSVAVRFGLKAANLMWPGPPTTTTGISPTYFVPYRVMDPSTKLDQLLAWIDMDAADRPQLITGYIPEVDQKGHHFGPDSAEVNDTLALVDSFAKKLDEELKQRNLTDIVNLIYVSDHGMASTSNQQLVFLDDILGEEGYAAIEHKDGWPSVGIRFNDAVNGDAMLDKLLLAADNANGTFAVYTHETMPKRFHFADNERIAPIYLVPKVGWAITDHHEHEVLFEGDYQPKGNHGYDNRAVEMRAAFVADGPFASAIKAGATVPDDEDEAVVPRGFISTSPHVIEGFQNLEIYSLVTSLLGLKEVEPPHNGTKGFWGQYLG